MVLAIVTLLIYLCGRLEYKVLDMVFIRKRIWFLHIRLSIECFLEVEPDHLDLAPVEDPVEGGEEHVAKDSIDILSEPERILITYQPSEKTINSNIFFCIFTFPWPPSCFRTQTCCSPLPWCQRPPCSSPGMVAVYLGLSG